MVAIFQDGGYLLNQSLHKAGPKRVSGAKSMFLTMLNSQMNAITMCMNYV